MHTLRHFPRYRPRLRHRFAMLLALVLLAPALATAPPARAAGPCDVTSGADSGMGTLRDLIAGSCPVITFALPPAANGTITLASRLVINRSVTIQGPGASGLALKYTGPAANPGSVIMITSGTVILRGLTLTGGHTLDIWGAGLTISGSGSPSNVTLDGVTVTSNTATNASGGGIYASNTTLALIDSVVSNNTADNATSALSGPIHE